VGSIFCNLLHGVFTLFITFVGGVGADVASGSLQDITPGTINVKLERKEEGEEEPKEPEAAPQKSKEPEPAPGEQPSSPEEKSSSRDF
jgi:hypothetical protein